MTENMLWTSAKLAEYLGLSERRIRQLRDMKIFTEKAKGLYEPLKNIRAYIAYISGEKGADGALSLAEEKAKLTKIKRKREQLEYDAIRGDYHTTEEIRAVVTQVLISFRAKLMSIPATMAKTLAAESEPADIDKLLDDKIRETLEELSDLKSAFNIEIKEDGEDETEND